MEDYYSEFQFFDKFAKQTESIAEAIANIDLRDSYGEVFTFVDVGSNDGSLTAGIIELLSRKYVKIKTYASEPEKKPFEGLKARFGKNPNVQVDNLDFYSWAEKYKEEFKHGGADIILNSHTFYHFLKNEWKGIIDQCDGLLKQGGAHIIIIDSDRSAIFQIRQKLEAAGLKKAKKYGELLVGTDIEKFLESEGAFHEHRLIGKPIVIPANNDSLKNFCRVLGFVLRYSYEDILGKAGKTVADFMVKYRTGGKYIFPRYQDMFILWSDKSG